MTKRRAARPANRRAGRSAPPRADIDQAPDQAPDHALDQAADPSPDPVLGVLPAGVVPFGRIPVANVTPVVDNGARPAKSVVDEQFTVTAQVFREGHDAVNASVVLTDPDGHETLIPMVCLNPGLSLWSADVAADRPGRWTYRVEGWSDPWATWVHDASIKVMADVDAELMLTEGAQLLERAARRLPAVTDAADGAGNGAKADEASTALLTSTARALLDTSRPPIARLREGTHPDVHGVFTRYPMREMVSPSVDLMLLVERARALYGAWYEIFPRSEGATKDPITGEWTTGTLATARRRLPAIADMGFDVVYLTPVHPIGTTARKGRNNALTADPGDPGSPYAIGSPDGGHDAIEPSLGTFADFADFVAEASRLGLEVALDIALQCSPDHPWVTEYPQLFTTRADGTIAYAENPPKKYQDIYPLNFDNDPALAYAQMRRVIQVWLDHGVRIFRVDNPHTKPVQFWQWLIADVAVEHPETIWLSEAFTKPAMMATLAKAGFQQSYTYFAWRNLAWELRDYVTELATDTAAFLRPSFWPTTHDILTPFMQFGGPTAWKLRATLAATLVPTYGIYAGYELMENVARPGVEEQIDNEKYEFKDRHWADYEPGGAKEGRSLAGFLTRLNSVRRAHPALHWLRNITFHPSDDEAVLVYSKTRTLPDGTQDTVLVAANCDPHSTRSTVARLNMPALGAGWDDVLVVREELTGAEWEWTKETFLRLGPETEPAHIVTVVSTIRS